MHPIENTLKKKIQKKQCTLLSNDYVDISCEQIQEKFSADHVPKKAQHTKVIFLHI